MTRDEAVYLFGNEDDFLKFANIREDRRLHKRPDINAFLLLDRLCPGERDMVSDAEHDEIYLAVDVDDIAETASEDDILDLVRCGVRHDDDHDCLCMFA